MPARGPKPKPTALKVLAGTNRPDRANPAEARPRAQRPTCPAHLCPAARSEWRRIIGELEPLGLVTKLDRAALAAYCQAWGRWVEAEEALRKHGVLVKSPSGFPMQSPYLAVANKAMNQMRLLLQEFGMSPSSRSRATASPIGAQEETPLMKLLRQREEWTAAGDLI